MLSDYIEKTPGTCGGKPRLKGRRIRVQDIAYYSEWCGWTPDRIADSLDLSLAEVHAGLVYYFENIDEIRGHMKADDDLAQDTKRNTPSKLNEKLKLRTDLGAEPKSA